MADETRYYDVRVRLKVFDPRISRAIVESEVRGAINAKCRGMLVTEMGSERVVNAQPTPPHPKKDLSMTT